MKDNISRIEGFVKAVVRDMKGLDQKVKNHKEEYGFGHESIEHDINVLKKEGDFRHVEMKLHRLEDLVQSFVRERTSLSRLFALYGAVLINFPKEQ